ncbi:MAG: Gfo/Idh/MocA family oxidoreductase [Sedimentisphaerales bacterium]|nr:Gfo/Idh/MocA family oxidoreductase [Sedimentisphaerales bacterium]
MNKATDKGRNSLSRRDFVKASAAAGAAALGIGASRIYAAGSDKVRLGLIGCGGRGRHDCSNCLKSATNVELAAMGDLFGDQLEGARNMFEKNLPDKVKLSDDTCFTGWDAFKKVLACDVDMVILTTPPGFRPEHLAAAVEAGKHVFMEKPVAVDPVGVRSVIESSALAEIKGLTIVAGTQMRKIAHLMDGVKRIHDGDIGEIVGGQCVRIGGGMLGWGPTPRKAEWTDMEWQLRRWLFLTWLSGDFIAEMHVHNLDIMNWVLGGPPVRCMGLGGREVRTGAEYGNVYDHFSVEYEYANGVRVEYMGAQIEKASDRCDQHIVGTKGSAFLDFANAIIEGPKAFKYDGPAWNPEMKQHADQISAIREGKRLNEGKRIAESSLTSIMGRMSAYTGRSLKWDWAMKASKLDLRPAKYEFGDLEMRPVAVPGQTPLV